MTIKSHSAVIMAGGALAAFVSPQAVLANDQAATQQSENAAQPENALGDIVVTATRRSDSIQNVPIAIQALGSSSIRSLNIQSFSDYVSYLPNVNFAGRGPGQNDVYIRGMSTNKINVFLSGANGTEPNVALYLDDQPVSLLGRNLDIFVTDMERIEVLEGPQGTLFGSSSQAGNVRLITKKPSLRGFEGSVNGGVSFTKNGEMSTSVEAAFNVPLIQDKLALRIAAYTTHNGGYIDNVHGTQALSPLNPAYPGARTTYDTTDNGPLVQDNFNTSEYTGFRAGLKYEFAPDWTATVQHSRQTLISDGVFDYDPTVGDLQVKRYFPDPLKDQYSQTSWNLEGKIGALNAIYTGGYISRKINQTLDYTGYGNVGPFIPYYICNYPSYTHCGQPTLGVSSRVKTSRWNHEFRLSTPADWRLRGTVGVFHDKGRSGDITYFYWEAMANEGFARNRPLQGAVSNDPSFAPAGVGFINDYIRTASQLSFFGEGSFDIIPSKLILTAGLRRYHLEYGLTGSSSFANRGAVDGEFGRNITTLLAGRSPGRENGLVPRITLTVKPNNDLMFYGTWSRGFRPGGFNRGGGEGNARARIPYQFTSDTVENWELGWKTKLFNNHLRWNGTLYLVKWKNMQVSAFDPSISKVTFVDNAADAEIKGLESNITLALDDHITFDGAMSYNRSKLTSVRAGLVDIAPLGSSLAQSPRFQGNLRGRYTFDIGTNEAYFEAGIRHSSLSYNSIQISKRFAQAPFTMINLSAGITHGNWTGQAYIENITDERAQYNVNAQDEIKRITVARPRTVGLKIGYNF